MYVMYIYVCVYVRMYVRTYVCMSVCMYVCARICMCVCVCMLVCDLPRCVLLYPASHRVLHGGGVVLQVLPPQGQQGGAVGQRLRVKLHVPIVKRRPHRCNVVHKSMPI